MTPNQEPVKPQEEEQEAKEELQEDRDDAMGYTRKVIDLDQEQENTLRPEEE
jgi:hypothetical protein